MPLEDLAELLADKTEDRTQVLSGHDYEQWVQLRTYALQGDVSSLYDKVVQGEEDEVELHETIPSPSKDNRLKALLQQAISRLPTDQQLVVVLHDLLGMTLEEVAFIDARGRTEQALGQAQRQWRRR
jgi:DNA-directed RNA polymerase specialized sigma subunit